MIDVSNFLSPSSDKELERKLEHILSSSGIFYRLFVRTKTDQSIESKLNFKRLTNDMQKYKMQDLFGCRVVCYFEEDIPICEQLLCEHFTEIEKDRTIDELDKETFKPVRRNYVFKLPEDILGLCDSGLWKYPIDQTFECQFRSVLSEGWHEVDHDLRYKSLSFWDDQPLLSRKLNALLATLETSEWALTHLLDDMAYNCYKKRKWEAMIKFKIRLRFEENDVISSEIIKVLDEDINIGKRILILDKMQLIKSLVNKRIPIKMNNIIYLENWFHIKNERLLELTPPGLRQLIDTSV